MLHEQRKINSDQVREERYRERFTHQCEVITASEIELYDSETSQDSFRLQCIQAAAEFKGYHVFMQMWQTGMDINEVFNQSRNDKLQKNIGQNK